MHANQPDPQAEIFSQLKGGQSGAVVFGTLFHAPSVDFEGHLASPDVVNLHPRHEFENLSQPTKETP